MWEKREEEDEEREKWTRETMEGKPNFSVIFFLNLAAMITEIAAAVRRTLIHSITQTHVASSERPGRGQGVTVPSPQILDCRKNFFEEYNIWGWESPSL